MNSSHQLEKVVQTPLDVSSENGDEEFGEGVFEVKRNILTSILMIFYCSTKLAIGCRRHVWASVPKTGGAQDDQRTKHVIVGFA